MTDPAAPPTSNALGKQAATLSRLAAVGLEPLLQIEDLAVLFRVSRREIERQRSGGRLPRPDFAIGRSPRWTAATVRAHLAKLAGEGRE